jgi:hypothetical protein
MERRAGLCLAGTMLALALISLPALAQKNRNRTVTTTTTTTTTTTYFNNGAWDMSMPVSPESDEITAMRVLADHNFTRHDIQKVLPLVMDLQTCEDNYFDATHNTLFYIATSHDPGRIDVTAYQQGFRDRCNNIWGAIDKEIGSDKGEALRSLVSPQRIDINPSTYHTAWLDRIDQDLRDWDRISAARMAANGQTPDNSSTTVTVSTTTTAVDTSIIPSPIYTFPPLTTRELENVLWMRLTAHRNDPEAWMSVRGPDDFTSPEIRFVREHHLRNWQ